MLSPVQAALFVTEAFPYHCDVLAFANVLHNMRDAEQAAAAAAAAAATPAPPAATPAHGGATTSGGSRGASPATTVSSGGAPGPAAVDAHHCLAAAAPGAAGWSGNATAVHDAGQRRSPPPSLCGAAPLPQAPPFAGSPRVSAAAAGKAAAAPEHPKGGVHGVLSSRPPLPAASLPGPPATPAVAAPLPPQPPRLPGAALCRTASGAAAPTPTSRMMHVTWPHAGPAAPATVPHPFGAAAATAAGPGAAVVSVPAAASPGDARPHRPEPPGAPPPQPSRSVHSTGSMASLMLQLFGGADGGADACFGDAATAFRDSASSPLRSAAGTDPAAAAAAAAAAVAWQVEQAPAAWAPGWQVEVRPPSRHDQPEPNARRAALPLVDVPPQDLF